MASLFERAGIRCEQNILRRWPAWRQAHITPAERPSFDAWKAANVARLQSLRADIVAGGTPDIDRGWPDPSDPRWDTGPMPAEVPAPAALPAATTTLTATYTFDREFLELERLTSAESLADVDRRLLAEYEALEVARPLDEPGERRRRELFDNFYDFKG